MHIKLTIASLYVKVMSRRIKVKTLKEGFEI